MWMGRVSDAVSSYTFSNVQATHTITASYAVNTYAITVTQGSNGVIAPGTTTVNYGGSQTFTITPSTGYHIASITVDSGAVTVTTPSGQTVSFSNVQATHTITASYAVNTYAITVTQGSNGVIAPGTTTVNYGGESDIHDHTKHRVPVSSVVVDGSSVGAVSSYTFSNVQATHTITASYAVNTYAITVTQGSNGVIAPGTTTVNYGGSQTFTITPSTGYHIASITVDSGAVTVTTPSGQTVSFSNVQATHTITASFTSVGGLLPLHTSGANILDTNNNVVHLRGVDNPNFLVDATGSFTTLGTWNATAAQADAENMASHGFNLVRLLINMDWYDQNLKDTWNGPNTATRGCRDCVDDYISYCNQNGVYVLLVPWQILGCNASNGGGQTGQTPYPWGVAPYATAADYANWCVRTATGLSPYPNVVFELYNEPNGDESTWFSGAQQAITAIRGVSQIPVVIQYGYCGGFDWVARHTITGGNIIYSNHIYRSPAGNTMLSNMGILSEGDIRSYLITQWRYNLVAGVKPMLIGEIGAYDSSYDEVTWLQNTLAVLNGWNASYAGWQWSAPASGYPLKNADGSPNTAGQILIDAIAGAGGVPVDLSVVVSPGSVALQVGHNVTLSAVAMGGVSPYTVRWYDGNHNLLSSGPSYTFTSSQSGTYTIYANVTDSSGSQGQRCRRCVGAVPLR